MLLVETCIYWCSHTLTLWSWSVSDICFSLVIFWAWQTEKARWVSILVCKLGGESVEYCWVLKDSLVENTKWACALLWSSTFFHAVWTDLNFSRFFNIQINCLTVCLSIEVSSWTWIAITSVRETWEAGHLW
jgi:hypothetical protein